MEPVFGQINERRNFWRLTLRGFDEVRFGRKLVCLASKLLKLYGRDWAPQVHRPLSEQGISASRCKTGPEAPAQPNLDELTTSCTPCQLLHRRPGRKHVYPRQTPRPRDKATTGRKLPNKAVVGRVEPRQDDTSSQSSIMCVRSLGQQAASP